MIGGARLMLEDQAETRLCMHKLTHNHTGLTLLKKLTLPPHPNCQSTALNLCFI